MQFKTKQLTRAICLALLTGTALISSAQAATTALTPPASMSPADMKEMESHGKGKMGHMDMKAHMKKSMENMQSMTMTGNPDKDFAAMMRMHHQCGVEMAQMQLEYGKNAEMKAMAKKIAKAQKLEIAEFDRWIAKQK